MNSRIVEVTAVPLVRNLAKIFSGGTYQIRSRYTLVTHVRLEDGTEGEIFGGDEERYQKEVCTLINGPFQELLLGEDVFAIEYVWERLFTCKKLGLENRGIHVLDLNNKAIVMEAIAAVDLALWDAMGKFTRLPVYKLLGGYRDKVPVIAIGGYYSQNKTEDDLRREILQYRASGLAGVKLKVGALSPSDDVDRARLVREATGDDFILACDANQAWTVSQALEFCGLAKDLNIRWLEEPVQWFDQLQGLKIVRAHGGIPVTAGQGEISRFGCRDLALAEAVDVLNVDATIAGGLTEWRRIAAMAGMLNIGMGHHEEPQIALHLLASIPHGLYVEVFPDPERDPMWFDLPVQQPRIADGFMHLTEEPGFGITLRPEVVERYDGNRYAPSKE